MRLEQSYIAAASHLTCTNFGFPLWMAGASIGCLVLFFTDEYMALVWPFSAIQNYMSIQTSISLAVRAV